MTADYDAAVKDHVVDLLHVGGELVGLVEMVPEAGYLLIENVAVAPASQGQGYGRTLLAHAEHVAKSLGLGAMRLYTNQGFRENLQLYNHLGYEVEREEVLPHGVVVPMSKPLRAGNAL
jgi:GNAT superfamily N-acetyltransferase